MVWLHYGLRSGIRGLLSSRKKRELDIPDAGELFRKGFRKSSLLLSAGLLSLL